MHLLRLGLLDPLVLLVQLDLVYLEVLEGLVGLLDPLVLLHLLHLVILEIQLGLEELLNLKYN